MFPRGAGKKIEEPIVELIAIFNTLQIFGFLSLAAIFVTVICSPTIHRSPTWHVFIASWMWWCLSHLLIMGQQTGPPPHSTICHAQAVMVYAVPVLTSWSGLALVLQLYLSVYSTFNCLPLWVMKYGPIVLLVAPSALNLVVILEVVMLSFQHPEMIQRDISGMYCNISGGTERQITAVLAMVACGLLIVSAILTGIKLARNWAAFRCLQADAGSDLSLAKVIRLSLFSLLLMSAFLLGFLHAMPSDNLTTIVSSRANLFVAACESPVPSTAGIAFCTQQDILDVWLFWRRNPEPRAESELPVPLRPPESSV